VITAYYSYQKLQDGEDSYKEWMNAFAFLHNTVTLYTDEVEIGMYFTKIRQELNFATVVVQLPKSSMWPFQLLPDIEKFYFARTNTSFPADASSLAYETSTTLSKIAIIQHAVYHNLFSKDYNCWLNIDFLSITHVADEKLSFRLNVPDNLSKTNVGLTTLPSPPGQKTSDDSFDVIKGGIYVGHFDSLSAFCKYFEQLAFKLFTQKRTDKSSLYVNLLPLVQGKRHPSSFDIQFYSDRSLHQLFYIMHQKLNPS